MKDVKIHLQSTEEIIEFNKIITKFSCDFDLEVGRSYIDAKSLLGIYSLSLNKPLLLHIQANEDVADEVIQKISHFLCEEEMVLKK